MCVPKESAQSSHTALGLLSLCHLVTPHVAGGVIQRRGGLRDPVALLQLLELDDAPTLTQIYILMDVTQKYWKTKTWKSSNMAAV